MAQTSALEEMERLQLSEEDTEELWNSPSQRKPRSAVDREAIKKTASPSPDRPRIVNNQNDITFDQEQAREVALRHELQTVKRLNEAIEGVLDSLRRARGNMDTVSRTVDSASTLLNTWTRILSQTEHNQRLILNPKWQGASQDIADMESEALAKQQATERRELELQQRREAAQRKAEEEERKKSETASGTARNVRGTSRGRAARGGMGRTPYVSQTTRGQIGTRGTNNIVTTASRKPGSGITRGTGSVRGHGRT